MFLFISKKFRRALLYRFTTSGALISGKVCENRWNQQRDLISQACSQIRSGDRQPVHMEGITAHYPRHNRPHHLHHHQQRRQDPYQIFVDDRQKAPVDGWAFLHSSTIIVFPIFFCSVFLLPTTIICTYLGNPRFWEWGEKRK